MGLAAPPGSLQPARAAVGWPGLLSLSQLGTDQLLSLPVVEKQEISGTWLPLTLYRLHHDGLLEFHPMMALDKEPTLCNNRI